MADERARDARDPAYGRGFRQGIGMVVRGLLLVEADQVDVGALVGALSRYEQDLEAWIAGGGGATEAELPAWRPTGRELGADVDADADAEG